MCIACWWNLLQHSSRTCFSLTPWSKAILNLTNHSIVSRLKWLQNVLTVDDFCHISSNVMLTFSFSASGETSDKMINMNVWTHLMTHTDYSNIQSWLLVLMDWIAQSAQLRMWPTLYEKNKPKNPFLPLTKCYYPQSWAGSSNVSTLQTEHLVKCFKNCLWIDP